MTTIIFVHGTGVRKAGYAEALKVVEDALNKTDINLYPCLWGEKYGTKLNADGASIPDYKDTREYANLDKHEPDNVLLWQRLYQDSLYEIRLLSLKPEGIVIEEEVEKFSERVQNFTPSPTLRSQLEKANIAQVFNQAHQKIIESQSYGWLLDKISGSFKENYAAISRAMVAEALISCENESIFSPIRFNAKRRDEIVDAIISELTQNEQEQGSISDFGKNLLIQTWKYFGNKKLHQEEEH